MKQDQDWEKRFNFWHLFWKLIQSEHVIVLKETKYWIIVIALQHSPWSVYSSHTWRRLRGPYSRQSHTPLVPLLYPPAGTILRHRTGKENPAYFFLLLRVQWWNTVSINQIVNLYQDF